MRLRLGEGAEPESMVFRRDAAAIAEMRAS